MCERSAGYGSQSLASSTAVRQHFCTFMRIPPGYSQTQRLQGESSRASPLPPKTINEDCSMHLPQRLERQDQRTVPTVDSELRGGNSPVPTPRPDSRQPSQRIVVCPLLFPDRLDATCPARRMKWRSPGRQRQVPHGCLLLALPVHPNSVQRTHTRGGQRSTGVHAATNRGLAPIVPPIVPNYLSSFAAFRRIN